MPNAFVQISAYMVAIHPGEGSKLACSDVSVYAICIKCSWQLPEVLIEYGVCTAWKVEQMEN